MTAYSVPVLESPSNLARYLRSNGGSLGESRQPETAAQEYAGSFSWPLSQQSLLQKLSSADQTNTHEGDKCQRSSSSNANPSPPDAYQKGELVQVRWDEDGKWYPAQVLKSNADRTCIVMWEEDEDSRYRCRLGAMRRQAAASLQSLRQEETRRDAVKSPSVKEVNACVPAEPRTPVLGRHEDLGPRVASPSRLRNDHADLAGSGVRSLGRAARGFGFQQTNEASVTQAGLDVVDAGTSEPLRRSASRADPAVEYLLRDTNHLSQSKSGYELREASSGADRFLGGLRDDKVHTQSSSTVRGIVEGLAQMEQRCAYLAERNDLLTSHLIHRKRAFLERVFAGKGRAARGRFLKAWHGLVQELRLEKQLQTRREQMTECQRGARELASMLAAEQQARRTADEAGRQTREEVDRLLGRCADTQDQMHERSARMEVLERRLREAENIIGRSRQEALAVLGSADDYEKKKQSLVQQALGVVKDPTQDPEKALQTAVSGSKAIQLSKEALTAASFMSTPQRSNAPVPKMHPIPVMVPHGARPAPPAGALSSLPPSQQRQAPPWPPAAGCHDRAMSPDSRSRSPSPPGRQLQFGGNSQRLGAWVSEDSSSRGGLSGAASQVSLPNAAAPPAAYALAAQRPVVGNGRSVEPGLPNTYQASMRNDAVNGARGRAAVPAPGVAPNLESMGVCAGSALICGAHPPSAMNWQGDTAFGKHGFPHPPSEMDHATAVKGQDWRALLSAPLTINH